MTHKPDKAYKGKNKTGCHKCGGHPGSAKRPVNKLYHCSNCGFYTCNKHLVGLSRACPGCGNDRVKVVMTGGGSRKLSKGGMPEIGKKETPKAIHRVDRETEMESSGGFASSSSSGENAPESDNKENNIPLISKLPSNDKSKQEQLQRASDAIQAAITEGDQLIDEVIEGLPTMNIENKTAERQKLGSSQEQNSEYLEEDKLEGNPADNKEQDKKYFIPQSHKDDEIDFESFEKMDLLLKKHKEGFGLTSFLKTDAYFRPGSIEGFKQCYDYLKNPQEEGRIFVISVDASQPQMLEILRDLMDANPHVFGCVGFGAQTIKGSKLPDLQVLEDIITSSPKFVGIGEIGLDLHYAPHTIDTQAELFIEQIKLAIKLDKPVYMSSVNSDLQIANIVQEFHQRSQYFEGIYVPVIRSPEILSMCLEQGFYLLLRPEITYKEEALYRQCLMEIPQQRWLVASGEELTAPAKRRGKWNSPEYIDETTDFLVDYTDMPKYHFLDIVAANFNKLFNSAPTAVDDEFDGIEDKQLVITTKQLLENDTDIDGDVITVVAVDEKSINGGRVVFDKYSGNIVYSPKAGFKGSDMFNYTITDGRGGKDSATVTIHLKPKDADENTDFSKFFEK